MDRDTARLEAAVYLTDIVPKGTKPQKLVEMASAFVHFVERTVCCLDHGWPSFMKQLREHGLTMAIEIFTRETQHIVAENDFEARILFAVVVGMRQAGEYDPAKAGELSHAYINTLRKHDFNFIDADLAVSDDELVYDHKTQRLWQKPADKGSSGNLLH